MIEQNKSPWLGNKSAEIIFILAPAILCCVVILCFKTTFETHEVEPIWWLILVLGIDVSHVYSSLYRTYFDKVSFKKNRDLYIYTPISSLVIGILLYSIHPMAFWRVLAYLAVFHFMRQQYGIMRLYERNENNTNFTKKLNSITIYAAVLYPILYWHFEPNRQFSWFIEGDFLSFSSPAILAILGWAYAILLSFFVGNTLYLYIFKKYFNVPKNIWIIGTILSWYIGIVAFNADLIFTTLNIVSHGIPYMALIWIYGKKQSKQTIIEGPLKLLYKSGGILAFIGILLLLAFVEEGLWDSLVWREHLQFFTPFIHLPMVTDSILLTILIPLLSLPQATHYVLDAYIWKIRNPTSNLLD